MEPKTTTCLGPLLGEGSPIKIDNRKKGTLILASLLGDLAVVPSGDTRHSASRKSKQKTPRRGTAQPVGASLAGDLFFFFF